MKTRHARQIRQGIHYAKMWLDPVVGNPWWIRAAYAGGSLTMRAFDTYTANEFHRRVMAAFARNGLDLPKDG